MSQSNRRCFLVGTSSQLLEQELGAMIDESDRVLRFGEGETKGFEKHVGTKKDIFVTGPEPWAEHTPEFYQAYQEIWCPRPSQDALEAWQATLNLAAFHACTPNLETALRRECHAIDPTDHMPSTGFIAIHMAMGRFPEHEIHIAGFDQWKGGYYWLGPEENRVRFSIMRDLGQRERRPWKGEKILMNQLVFDGKIHIHRPAATTTGSGAA